MEMKWLREWLPLLPIVERRRERTTDTGQRRRLTDSLETTIEMHAETVSDLVAFLNDKEKKKEK